MKTKTFMIRQGDVFVRKIDTLPTGAREAKPDNKRLILAHGEATGHHHSVAAAKAKLYRDMQGKMFLIVVAKMVQLIHQEHVPLSIPEGIYEVIRQREYTPQEIRNVRD